MATQLLHVMGARLTSGEALPAFLQIDQCNLDRGRLAFAADTHENMLM